MSINLCVNREARFADGAIMPEIIAELQDGKFVSKNSSKQIFVKINTRKKKLTPGEVGIWENLDDDDFDKNVEVTSRFNLVEVLYSEKLSREYDESNKYDSFQKIRKSLFNGTLVDTEKSIETESVFIVIQNINEQL